MTEKSAIIESQYSLFNGFLTSRLKGLNFNVYSNAEMQYTGEIPFSFIGTVDAENLCSLKEYISIFNYKTVDIQTPGYEGIYFEASPELSGIIVSPGSSEIFPDQDTLNLTMSIRMAKELREFGKEKGIRQLAMIDQYSFGIIWGNLKKLIAEKFSMTLHEIDCIEYENSYCEFKRHFLDFRHNRTSSFLSEEPANFDHIKYFSWIYFWEIKLIAELAGGGDLSIHDAGTCLGYLPVLLSGLSVNDVYGSNFKTIIASDIELTGDVFAGQILKKNPENRIVDFITLDLINDSGKVPQTDVVIINDVLEHLLDDESSFAVLKNLWDKTGKILIAHVPYEKDPDPSWGHCVTFDEQKIRQWALRLPDAHFISDIYPYDRYRNLIHEGYLVAVRITDKGFSGVDFYNMVKNTADMLDFKVYINSGWLHSENKAYKVLGAVSENNLDSLVRSLMDKNLKVIKIETEHYLCIYFSDHRDGKGLIISPRRIFMSTEARDFNESRKDVLLYELRKCGKERELDGIELLDNTVCESLSRQENFVISDAAGIPLLQLFFQKLKNSYKEYLEHYICLKKGHCNTGSGRENFFERASRVFYTQIKIIAGYFPGRKISIYDAGNTAQWPLLLNALTGDDLFGLNVSCVYTSHGGITARNIISKITGIKNQIPVKLVKSGFEILDASTGRSDVIVANEMTKFQCDENALCDVLKRLWNMTGSMLIVHFNRLDSRNASVEIPDENNISKWASALTGGRSLSSSYFDDDDNPLSSSGYMIVARENQ